MLRLLVVVIFVSPFLLDSISLSSLLQVKEFIKLVSQVKYEPES